MMKTNYLVQRSFVLLVLYAPILCLGCEDAEIDASIEESTDLPTDNQLSDRHGVRQIPVPSVLSSNPNDPDWVFDGYFQERTPEEIAILDEKNKYVATLSDDDYKAYKEWR